MLASGDFREPTTRHPFSIAQLRDIDCLVGASDLRCRIGSVVKAFQNQEEYEAMRGRRDMLEGLERCVGEVVNSFLEELENAVNNTGVGSEETEVKLCSLFFEFDQLFSQLEFEDLTLAKSCLRNYSAMIKGPPNRPSPKHRMRKAVLNMLSEKQAALSSSSVILL